MARVTLCLLFLLLVLKLQQSDAVSKQCNELQEEIGSLEKEITSVRELKHQYEQFYGQCNENLTQQIHTMETNSRKHKETEEVISYLKTTIYCLTNTVQSFNQTEHGLREKGEHLQATIDGLTKREEANKRTVHELLQKQKQMQATIDGLTKTVGPNIRTVQELHEKQKNMQATIDGLTKTVGPNIRTVQELLEKQKQMQATIDKLTKTGETMNQKFKMICGQPKTACRNLIQAIKSGQENIVRILASCTDDQCTTEDSYHDTPIIVAAVEGHLEVVRVLVEGGANLEATDVNKVTALHAAALRGYLEISRLLLDGGAKVDPVNRWKQTPLHRAAEHGYLSLVQLLVLRGANVSLKDENGKTASNLAWNWGYWEVGKWLDTVGRA